MALHATRRGGEGSQQGSHLMREAINMPSDMQSAQGRGCSRGRTAECVGLTRHTIRGGSSRELEERYKCMRCTCMWKGSCSGSVRVAHDVPHAGGSPCEVAASGTCRWQPPQGGQSVSQSVSRGKPPTYADARTSPKVAAGSPQIPSGSPVAQLFECRAKKWQGPQSSAYECERSVSP